MNRFEKHYENIVCYDLLFKDHFINVMQLPKLDHVTLNTGIGLKGILDRKQLLTALLGLEFISNQRALITRAKKSIDKFKLREKMPLGCKVTLRKKHLYLFIDSLINTVIPVMDNSSDIYNSKYLKNYLLQREIALESFLVHPNALENLNEKESESNSNNSINLNQFYFLKWTSNLFNSCSKDIRFKCWLFNNLNSSEQYSLSLNNKKFFLPKGKDYLFYNFSMSQIIFLQNHNFNFYLNFQKVTKNNKMIINKNKNTLNYSIAFGLKDFVSSTTFGNLCGDLESSHGLDIVFVINLLRNKNLKKPQYFLSSFQIPF